MPGRLQLRLSGVLCVLAVGISCWLCLPPAACAGKSVLIEQVEVQVRAEKNLPEPVRQRMEKSVAAIAGQLLEGRKTAEVSQAREVLMRSDGSAVLAGSTAASLYLP